MRRAHVSLATATVTVAVLVTAGLVVAGLVVAGLVVAGLIVGGARGGTDSTPVAGPSSLASASLDRVVKVPAPRYTRTMHAATTLPHVTARLDDCGGPVAVDLGPRWPTLVAEHDYCGGAAWISRLRTGQAVELSGRGIGPGLYVVTGLTHQVRGEATVRDLPPGDAVLQTCVSKTTIVLVALAKFAEPDTPA